MLSYGSVCMYFFATSSRPQISSYVMKNSRSIAEQVNLSKQNFQIAFAVEKISNNVEHSEIDDPNFAEWAVFFEFKNNTHIEYQEVSYHKCTSEDYKKFNPIAADFKFQFE